MKLLRVNQVKKEIRVLGVSARRQEEGYHVIGVVFRGSLWLDGVMIEKTKGAKLTNAIFTLVTKSRHEGQIRVILLNRDSMPPETKIDLIKLYEETGKPVILIGDTDREVGTSLIWGKGPQVRVVTAIGVSRWVAKRILETTTRTGSTPEALRVASVTISALLEGIHT